MCIFDKNAKQLVCHRYGLDDVFLSDLIVWHPLRKGVAVMFWHLQRCTARES